MRCKFSTERVRKSLEDGRLDTLLLSDCRPRNSGPEPLQVQDFDTHPPGHTQKYTLITSKWVAIATNLKIRSFDISPSGRILWADCTIRSRNIRLISVYAPPSKHTTLNEQVFAELTEITRTTPRRSEMICGGDFNARAGFDLTQKGPQYGPHTWGGTNPNSTLLLELLSACELQLPASFIRRPWKHRWTWRNPRSRKTWEIDHIITKRNGGLRFRSIKARNDICHGSDHRAVVAIVDLLLEKTPPPKRKHDHAVFSSLAVGNDPTLLQAFETKLSELPHTTTADPTTGYEADLQIIRTAALSTFPLKKRGNYFWLSQEYFEARRKLSAILGGKLTRQRQQSIIKLRRACERLKRRDLRRHARAKTATAISAYREGNTAEVYRSVNALVETDNPNKRRRIPTITHEGSQIRDTKEIANLYARHMVSSNRPTERRPTVTPEGDPWPPIQHLPLTTDDIRHAMTSLRSNRTPGPDTLTTEILKAGGETIVGWIHHIISPAWNRCPNARLPLQTKSSTVIPIPKKDRDLSCLDSYRPISLTSTLLKIVEHVILRRIQPTMTERLGLYQCGFLKNRQLAEHQLALRILTQQASANNSSFYAVFIDLKGAYDRLHRDTLFKVLSFYGVNNEIIDILREIYDDHSFRVCFRGETSTEQRSEEGVLQGSVTSPLLFNLYLDMVFRECMVQWRRRRIKGLRRLQLSPTTTDDNDPTRVFAMAYADDITLLAPNPNQARRMTEIFAETCKRFSLEISADKSSWTNFGKRSNHSLQPLRIPSLQAPIPHPPTTTYLGVVLDTDASDFTTIQSRQRAAWRLFNKLKKVLSDKNLPRKLRLQLLQATVFSCYSFGTETLTLRRRDLDRIKSFENRTYRLVMGDQESPREVIRETVLRTLPDHLWLSQRIRKKRLQLFGHVCRGQSLCRIVMNSTNPDQKTGRLKSYLKQMLIDVAHVQGILGTPTIAETVADRQRYRTACYEYVKEYGETGRLSCPTCRKEYIARKPYEKHLLSHQVRPTQPPRPAVDPAHMVRDAATGKFTGPFCSKTYIYKTPFEKHIVLHTPDPTGPTTTLTTPGEISTTDNTPATTPPPRRSSRLQSRENGRIHTDAPQPPTRQPPTTLRRSSRLASRQQAVSHI